LKLNPASAAAAVEAPKQPAKIDPVAAPISKVSPPVVAERRAPAPAATSPMRPSPSAGQKKSYLLPVTVAAIVLVLLLALPKLFRQKSDAAPPEATSNSSTTNSSAAKPVSSSKTAIATPKKSSSPAPELTETSQPAPAAKPSAPPVKSASKPAAGGATQGEVLDQVLPDVSDKARGTIHGTVRISVRAHVNRAGTVDSAELNAPSGSKYFSEQAIKAAKRWQFSAPEVNGRSVESEWLLRFEITPTATKVLPAQVSP
jgi:TonB family protein